MWELEVGFASVAAIQTKSRDPSGKVVSEVGWNIYFCYFKYSGNPCDIIIEGKQSNILFFYYFVVLGIELQYSFQIV